MKQISKHVVLNRIAVPRDAFIHLEQLQRKQRGCKPLTDEQLEKSWERKSKTETGMIRAWEEEMAHTTANGTAGAVLISRTSSEMLD